MKNYENSNSCLKNVLYFSYFEAELGVAKVVKIAFKPTFLENLHDTR